MMEVSESAEMIARSKPLSSDQLTVRSDRDVTVSTTLSGADPRFRACGDNRLQGDINPAFAKNFQKSHEIMEIVVHRVGEAMLARKVSV